MLHPTQCFSRCTPHKLNKQGDNIQPWHTPFPVLHLKNKVKEVYQNCRRVYPQNFSVKKKIVDPSSARCGLQWLLWSSVEISHLGIQAFFSPPAAESSSSYQLSDESLFRDCLQLERDPRPHQCPVTRCEVSQGNQTAYVGVTDIHIANKTLRHPVTAPQWHLRIFKLWVFAQNSSFHPVTSNLKFSCFL